MKCNQICKWNSNAGCVKPYGVPCILENVSQTGRKATNADRIRHMRDEELAEMLWKTGKNYRVVCADPVVDHNEQYAEIMNWLQQPAKEGE